MLTNILFHNKHASNWSNLLSPIKITFFEMEIILFNQRSRGKPLAAERGLFHSREGYTEMLHKNKINKNKKKKGLYDIIYFKKKGYKIGKYR